MFSNTSLYSVGCTTYIASHAAVLDLQKKKKKRKRDIIQLNKNTQAKWTTSLRFGKKTSERRREKKDGKKMNREFHISFNSVCYYSGTTKING